MLQLSKISQASLAALVLMEIALAVPIINQYRIYDDPVKLQIDADGNLQLVEDGAPDPVVHEVLEGVTEWDGVEIPLPAEAPPIGCCVYYTGTYYTGEAMTVCQPGVHTSTLSGPI